MLEVLPGPEHVVSMRASGRVETKDVERGIAAVEEALVRQDRIALYGEVAISGMTPSAFARDLGYGLRHLGELRRFARIAVVTEQEWVRQIVRAEGYILPQIEIRAFAEGERDKALVWVAQPIPAVEPEGATAPPSIHLLETTRPDVIAFEVKGRIRRDEMHLLVSAFEQPLAAHERLRVLVRVVSFDGVTLEALREEGLASVKMRGWRQVERCALVGGPAWMAAVASWAAPLVRIPTRHFDLA